MKIMKEIGSEFWSTDSRRDEKLFFLSGRTALEFIIRDIKASRDVESVALPSWCCHTMIAPFFRHGIQIRFYQVFFDSQRGLCAEKPKPEKNEIFYYMTYFGHCSINGLSLAEVVREWNCVISDETHSWLSTEFMFNSENIVPNYRFVSCRKWTGVYGISIAIKSGEKFSICPEYRQNETYLAMRKNAARLKMNYINGYICDKQEYLDKFSAAEEMLETDYIGYAPSVESIEQLCNFDKNFAMNRRRENAEFLVRRLAGIAEMTLLFDELKAGEVPLFVPVLVAKEDRDGLRKWLIRKEIYCPVHWPLSDWHTGISNLARDIYEQELSLLCDQRYQLEDMERIASAIEEYYESRRIF